MNFVNKNGEIKKTVKDFKLVLKVCRVKYDVWDLFKKYHYLSQDLNKAAKCYCAFLDGNPIAFLAILPQPSGYFKNGWRMSRTVVLPDYQGMGIGIRLRDYMASLVVGKNEGKLFSRSMHPAIGLYSEKHPELWQPTSHNKKKQDKPKGMTNYKLDTRPCYAFKYVGEPASEEECQLFYEKC